MSMRIKMVVDKFVEELKEALEADIQDRIMKEREMQSYIEEREREVAEREAAWKAQLSRREKEEMSMRIKMVVDKFVEELKEALEADIQDRIMKEREMQSYIEEREREVAEREAAWKAQLSRREAEIARQEARLKMERENLEKEKSVLMGTASNQDNQDGALEITVSGEKYRCLRFSKAKK
ncbi:hypothetical protein CTI12_AA309230 [Artemisia annua]|uniref:Uncharacterized protein n=1 Tax=Artemisia annua TaxID=35608 RepID=A0A2U1N4G4_ARTAN|nr:hypothetical protein CTI12_AA309230 [Artemisia annua]